jgi:hypothetical protein
MYAGFTDFFTIFEGTPGTKTGQPLTALKYRPDERIHIIVAGDQRNRV